MTPLFDSLNSAARMIVRDQDYRPGCINLERWSVTYRTDVETVREALKLAENGGRKLPEEIAVTSPQPKPVEEGHDE